MTVYCVMQSLFTRKNARVKLLPQEIAVLAAVYRKTSRSWLVSGLYLLSYGIIRFILEFLRGDAIRGYVGELSVSQVISIFIIAVGILLILSPQWLVRFGEKNDAIYAAWAEEYKTKVQNYKKYKSEKKRNA
ncbi:MAG: prolipoprotein diacylglyceryl transferase [Eubacterium sp.]|nr:prolipoprotein diacylglyceryl transferase [Eubacterium sp.]